ncbi:DUF4931 domain-containing protein [Peribacillus saganii]|uniref:DUF4931 domain-containing protein n=1 Tax=Peribacillus saganii TaxID=2303992 RepID=A0A372LSI7_9BACI|nr:DUF4931 domain-containing protein [Peribacillus saganii]RFU70514.1 DUF4931 domain-containing protein [Peribacillus saganii]
MDTHLHFVTQTGIKKPETIRNTTAECPFCAVEKLENIIAVEDSIILLKNKYETLKDTLQTVLIETDQCSSELSEYSKEHLYKVLRFAIHHWLQYEKSGDYASVILTKNHGPFSGGSIRHPHMQIIGLKNIDYRKNIQFEDFEGETIHKNEKVEFNLSTKPRIGFYEFNVILKDITCIEQMADCIQTAADFILNHFHFKCNSYNLFFYKIGEDIICKITPRFVTTPLFIGYSLPQVPDNLREVANRVSKYLTDIPEQTAQ